MNKNRKIFLVLLQVILWAALVALPYFMVPRLNDEQNMAVALRHLAPQPDNTESVFLSSLGFNFCLIIFFYLHHYLLFDKLVVKRRFTAYIASVSLMFVAIFFISYGYKRWLFPSLHQMHSLLSFREFVRAATWYMLILLISLGIKLLAQWRMAEQRAREVETEQLRTELSFLLAQINPHFLFNSLNTIYSLALKKSDAAPGAILKLSKLLRYVVDEASSEKVPLSREVEYLNNYIELQKLRSTSSLNVNFKVIGDTPLENVIAPLLLQPFVENAFKYGISSSDKSPIDIELLTEDHKLSFSIKNRNFSDSEKHSTGIGIANVQRRLELLYRDNYSLNIDDGNEFYSVNLTLKLQ